MYPFIAKIRKIKFQDVSREQEALRQNLLNHQGSELILISMSSYQSSS
jgi:hypothetical protein